MSTAIPPSLADAAAQKQAAYDAEPKVRLFHTNSGAGTLQHDGYTLNKGGSAIVPESVAKIWLTHTAFGNAVCEEMEPATPVAAGAEVAKLREENEAIREQNEEIIDANQALQTRLANLGKMLSEARAAAQKPAGVDVDKLPGSSPSVEEVAQKAKDEAARPAAVEPMPKVSVKPATSKKP